MSWFSLPADAQQKIKSASAAVAGWTGGATKLFEEAVMFFAGEVIVDKQLSPGKYPPNNSTVADINAKVELTLSKAAPGSTCHGSCHARHVHGCRQV